MKHVHWMVLVTALFAGLVLIAPSAVMAADPIVIGVPTSLGQPSGAEALNSVVMATEEINAQGGVNVGGTKRMFKVESMDIRDASPGVPVPDALLGLEKIILDKKVDAILVGPFRSEALLAGMDIIAKYKKLIAALSPDTVYTPACIARFAEKNQLLKGFQR